MPHDGVAGNEQLIGDLAIGPTLGDQPQDFQFPWGEP
jgi:hypothetical protein